MLVRELIEQLSEMPPELPVVAGNTHDYYFEVFGAVRTGRLDPNKVLVLLDGDDLISWARDWAEQVLEDAF